MSERCLARCCQSEDRKDQREGTGDYGEHHYTVVGKKHGFHHWPPLLYPADTCGQSFGPLLNSFAAASPESFNETENSGPAYVFLPT